MYGGFALLDHSLLATLSCLPLYSVCASLPHSLITWATVSPLLPHILHKGNSAVWSISRITCSQSLFLGATYQGLSTSFQIPFCWSTAKSYSLTYCPCILFCFHSFSVSFIPFTMYSFRSTASEMLPTLLFPTFPSNASSLFLTYQLKLFSSLLTQLSRAALTIDHDQASSSQSLSGYVYSGNITCRV